jgi:hypothetical protein
MRFGISTWRTARTTGTRLDRACARNGCRTVRCDCITRTVNHSCGTFPRVDGGDNHSCCSSSTRHTAHGVGGGVLTPGASGARLMHDSERGGPRTRPLTKGEQWQNDAATGVRVNSCAGARAARAAAVVARSQSGGRHRAAVVVVVWSRRHRAAVVGVRMRRTRRAGTAAATAGIPAWHSRRVVLSAALCKVSRTAPPSSPAKSRRAKCAVP